jgi:dolichyl-phosphate beta-glucosyltransferase
MAGQEWVVVVPCFNEADRLEPATFLTWLHTRSGVMLLFVDDGSQDSTGDVLERMAVEAPGRVHVLRLPENRGKAEAVRQGMLRALDFGPEAVAYWDADLATPLEALADFAGLLQAQPDFDILLGTRVQLLGRDIRRCAARHYVGRVFATAASLVLQLPVYDTQCGAKVFRASCVRQLFSEPFRTRWIFDVELLARCVLAQRPDDPHSSLRICEMPLRVWHDIAGSKVRALDGLRAFTDLCRIRMMMRRKLRTRTALPSAQPSAVRTH